MRETSAISYRRQRERER